jgi:two-component system CheB/CheR fusion protein
MSRTGKRLPVSSSASEAGGSAPPGPAPDADRARRQAEAILEQLADGLSGNSSELIHRVRALVGEEGASRKGAGRHPLRGAATAEAQLHLAEARYHTLLEQIPAVTFLAALDEGDTELYVSPQIEALLGFSQKEWLEDPTLWYRQLHSDDQQRWHEEFARTCATGVPFRADYRLIARDGRVVWVHGECQVVRDAEGRPLFLQGIAFDITQRKEAEAALQRMHDALAILVQQRTAELARVNQTLREEIRERSRLQEAVRQRAEQLAEESRRKDEFLATLAHELRNPLAPLQNALEVLSQHDVDARAIAWARDMMKRQIRHLTRLIDDLLDISRINQGKIELHTEESDLSVIVTHAAEAARPLLTERRHELTIALPSVPLPLRADPVRLEQVLVNLLGNAARYTDPSGHIQLSVQREAAGAVVRVRDDGIGIPADMLERIFELFTQVDRSLTRASQWGLGVGLSLARTLVEMHGGTLRAFSAGLGQGSEFIVTLPLASEVLIHTTPLTSGNRRELPGAPRVGRSVLVVDDSSDVAESMALLLRSWGYEVRVAHDGPAALAAARTRPAEVVLLDIGLPGMSGYEVAEHFRQQPDMQGALIIALTGYGREEDRRRARQAGFDHHLTKPVDPDTVKELLARSVAEAKGGSHA